MSNIFNRYYEKYDTWYDKHKFAYLSELKAIRKDLPKKGKGLEIGVGTGRFAGPLKIRFGIDPSKNMIKIARKRGVKARFGFGEKLPYKNNSFDYIAIIITICFVKDPKKVLNEAKRVLKKKHKLVIGIIDKESFLGRFYQRKKSLFYKQANFFSVKELIDLLKTQGFDGFSYRQTLFKYPRAMDSVERVKKGFGKGGFIVISARNR